MTMPKLSRRLLLLTATICWVAPLSAQQQSAAFGHAQREPDGCPSSKEIGGIVVSGVPSVGEVPVSEAARSAFMP
jgi:hypothetical protein